MQRFFPVPSRTLPVPQPNVGTLLGSSLSLPVIPGRHFCERTCLQTNQAAVFSCRCLSAGDNSGFCLPTGIQPSAHHRHLPAPRGRFTWPNPHPAPGSAAQPRQHRHGNVPSWLRRRAAARRGTRLGSPSLSGKSKRPRAPAGTVGMARASGSCSPVTPAHRFHVLPVPAQRS